MNRPLRALFYGLGALLAVTSLAYAQPRSQITNNITPTAADYGPWEIVTIDSTHDVGQFLSTAVDWNTRTPIIAYYDATDGDLKLAQQMPGNCGPDQHWNCAILDGSSSADVGQYVSLAVRSDGSYGAAYFDVVNGVNRFTSPADNLYGEVIEYVPGYYVGSYNALVYDNADIPRVFYFRDLGAGSNFGHAKRVGSGGNCTFAWYCQGPVYLDGYGYFSADVHPISGVGIAYTGNYGSGDHLGFAQSMNSGGNCGSGTWQCSIVENAPVRGTSIQMARCGLLSCSTPTQIAYYDYGSQQLKLAAYVGNAQGNCNADSNWRCSVIDSVGQTSNGAPLGISLLLVNGQQVIVYQDLNDQANSIVKIAWPQVNGNCGPNNSYACAVVDDGARGAGFVSVGSALDAVVIDGRIHMAYYEANHGDLLLAYEPAPTAVPNLVYLPLVKGN